MVHLSECFYVWWTLGADQRMDLTGNEGNAPANAGALSDTGPARQHLTMFAQKMGVECFTCVAS